MKFEWKQSLIWINVVLVYNGKIVTIPNCIVDTGSSSSMLDIDFVEFDYHKPTLIKRLFGIGAGKQEVLYQTSG